jgi:hypothetical protein
MALVEILSFEREVKPFFGISADTSANREAGEMLAMIQRWTENQARKFVGHVISQNTISNEYQRRDDISVYAPAEEVEVVGDTVYLTRDGGCNDGHVLQLDNGFVRSVTSLHEDPAALFGQGGSDFGAATELTAGTDFYIELDAAGISKSGRLIRNRGHWSSKPGTIRITYVAGLTATELNDEYSFVKLALLEDMQVKFNSMRSQRSAGGGPVKKETYHGDYSVEYAVSSSSQSLMSLSPGAQGKLHPIKRILL